MTAIETEKLVKRFGNFTALDRLDLTVPRGKICAFLGPNGAGKTTTLRILTGLAKPTSGQVMIEGVTIGSGHRAPIGFLPDTPHFYNWMNPIQFLTYIARLHDLENSPIEEALERVGLKEAKKKHIGGFSRGMKQRLGIAQALLHRPKVLLLDEPVSALDPAGRKEVLDIMGDLRGEMTVFFSTHILNDAERMCDTVAILDKGRLILQAEREDLLTRYVRPVFEIDTLPAAVSHLTALAEQLTDKPWAERVEVDGTALRVSVHDLDAGQRALLPMLTDIPVVRFERANATLEDAFLILTGSESEVVQ
jgi:ABC-2 type transport system ATP-binding protein